MQSILEIIEEVKKLQKRVAALENPPEVITTYTRGTTPTVDDVAVLRRGRPRKNAQIEGLDHG